MASNPRRKSDAARRANQVIRSRTVLVMLLLGIVTFAVLFWKLYDIQIRQHSVLQEKAIEQQTRSAVVNASRGTVYDRSLNTLAISATAETVLLSPLDIENLLPVRRNRRKKRHRRRRIRARLTHLRSFGISTTSPRASAGSWIWSRGPSRSGWSARIPSMRS